jgi:CRP-like cAMP-binding protein/small-conductance mechanosensitive channel
MNAPIWVTPELLSDAILFAGIAVALGLVSLLAPAQRRHGLLGLAGFAAAMLGGLALLAYFGVRLGGGMPYDIAREALLGLMAVAVIRAIVLFLAHVVLGRFRVPHILVDVLFGLGVLAYGIYRLNAIGVNLAGVVTTSAIVTGALAFSAGETLGNLWAGMSLQLENTLRIGDWVRIGDRIGQVVSIRWRSMAIATPANETIVVPNTMLMKDRIVVLGRAGESPALLRRSVPFQVDYDYSPAKVIRVITDALVAAELPNVSKSPAPSCVCREFQESGLLFHALYHPLDIGDLLATDSRVLVTIYSALQRAGMPIPYPQQVVELKRRSHERAAGERASREAVLRSMELFHSLRDDERATLAASMKRQPFAQGELVFRQGEPADSLYMLVEGEVSIVGENGNGQRKPLAELTAPAYFGEMGLLTGQPRVATVVATGDVLCYRLGKEAFDGVLQARPEIAEAMAQMLATRQAENDATLKALDAEARAKRAAGGALDLLRRIRHFFALPSARR